MSAPTQRQLSDLHSHNYAMSNDVACALWKAEAVAELIRQSVESVGPNGPVPEGIQQSVVVVLDLIGEALNQAGLK